MKKENPRPVVKIQISSLPPHEQETGEIKFVGHVTPAVAGAIIKNITQERRIKTKSE